jgi:hypothetical protein
MTHEARTLPNGGRRTEALPEIDGSEYGPCETEERVKMAMMATCMCSGGAS